jgi:hypothetical protein
VFAQAQNRRPAELCGAHKIELARRPDLGSIMARSAGQGQCSFPAVRVWSSSVVISFPGQQLLNLIELPHLFTGLPNLPGGDGPALPKLRQFCLTIQAELYDRQSNIKYQR